MTVYRVVDHVDQGLGLLIGQYKDKVRLEAWLSAYLKQCQLLEDALWDIRIKRMIDNAEGALLDMIGRIVGEKRLGRDDDLYKVFIYARIRINRSVGRASDILAVLALITAKPFTYDEYGPPAVVLEFGEVLENDRVIIYGMVRDTKAGGVKLQMIVPTTDPDHMFLWRSEDEPDVAAHGFGDESAPTGDGLLSDAVTAS